MIRRLVVHIVYDDDNDNDLSMCEQPRRDKGHCTVVTAKTSFVTNNTIHNKTPDKTNRKGMETIRGMNRVITRVRVR